ncbi:DUF1963 domain-containing protein [Nocardioides sp. dk4132]|uniref:YwqG family protein n=1 Tax=unclassified Nocardioides TaxID=2615069 RepID=UPI00129571E8|nr:MULTISPECIES: DUF1963 domain-containing protein [unclassified Nocardioides]MQW75485.1 DUF1963 domain-containing protein [Nocardioides sp. dk4132]QGA08403.1 DUF1963 domain-containing protein [Nocardioides sp. dk884]
MTSTSETGPRGPLPYDELALVTSRLGLLEGAEDVVDALADLAQAQARLLPDGPATDVRGSYVGGHPYLPAGTSWPTDEAGAPLAFVAQVNFADLAAALAASDSVPSTRGLQELPDSGLLQWFVPAVECFGLSFEHRDRAYARFYSADELTREAAQPVSAAVPDTGSGEWSSPLLHRDRATAVRFVVESSLPAVTDLHEGYRPERLGVLGDEDRLERIGEAAGDAFTDVYGGDTVPGQDDPEEEPPAIGGGDKVGGWPCIVQGDPRCAEAQDPAAAAPGADTLILQLDSDEGVFTEWGDSGIAWLFGDPASLRRGETSSLWWSWACY